MTRERHAAVEALFVENHARLLGFVRSKVDDADLAEDILQDGLLKALRAAPDVRDQERLAPWFFRIVRNAITDAYRRSGARSRALQRVAVSEVEEPPTPEDEARLCDCFRALLPTLKSEYAELIEAMDLDGVAPETMAQALGLTMNNLKVRRHRARRQLRRRLATTCGVCAEHGCTDCSCAGGA
ncbi:MAG: sigma-70 family RNA polymerase sigma factor [Gemmatimonadetes bacterium]|nr:sigma-70 family RNA polymerase sigma factor [Gemmatimonadota bacterium]